VHNVRVVFDPTYPTVDMCAFIKTDWKSMYGDVKELVPSDAPVPHGKEVDLRLFVDSDHTVEQFTRTGIVIYFNMLPILWFSKRQTTVESSVFRAEFAMKNGIEACHGLRYKLRMMDASLSGPTFVYGDNVSAVHNNHHPELDLLPCGTKVGCDGRIGHVPSVENPTDICTKVVPDRQNRNHLIRFILHDLCDCFACLVIFLAEEVCGSCGFPCCMGN
jgi:hypothetical protein